MNYSYLFDDPRNYKKIDTGNSTLYYAKCDNQWIEVDKSIYDALVQPILAQQKYDAYARQKGSMSFEYLAEKENEGLFGRINKQLSLHVKSPEEMLLHNENQRSIDALVECLNLCVQALSDRDQRVLAKLCDPKYTQRKIAQELNERENAISVTKFRVLRNLRKEIEQLPFDFENIDIP